MADSIASSYIHVANTGNFQSLVLDNSRQGPVLVNFWSQTAGPCLRQYPVLEKLARDHGGRFLLVNIDAEANSKILKDYGITSVPTLKLFQQMEVVETRHGYQSEADVKQMLMQYISHDSDKALAQALTEYTQGHQQQAYQIIAEAILDDPENPRLPIALCKLFKHEQRYDDAMRLLASLPEEIAKLREVHALRDEMSFIAIADKITDVDALIEKTENKKESLEDKVQLSAFYILNREYDLALQILDDIMEIDTHYQDDYARGSMLKVFNLLGNEHELVKKYRPSLNRYTH